MKNQFKFKPFDRVLVRNHSQHAWRTNIYSHCEKVKDPNNNLMTIYVCIDNMYKYCIPYNEETVHLIGTSEPYREPKKREWYVSSKGDIEFAFTTEEFKHFLTHMVVNNKDVTDFRVRYVPK